MCCILMVAAVGAALAAAGGLLINFSVWLPIIGGTTMPVILFWMIKTYLYIRKLPPGPRGWPVLGNLIELNMENALLKCQEYAKKFGKVFSMDVGLYTVVVINDYKLIQEALKKDEFQGRPDFEFLNIRNGEFKNRGILFTDGDNTWKEQRRFALTTLKDFGFGKQSMESMLLNEAQDLVNYFKTSVGQPVNVKRSFNSSVFNSLWYILSGERFERDDSKFQEIMSLMSTSLASSYIFNPGNFFPWPAKYNLIRPGAWARGVSTVKKTFELVDDIIRTHIDNYKENETRDYIDVYLHNHLQSSQRSSFTGEAGLQNLRVSLLDLFQAGSETTSTTLVWAILFLSKYPQIQRKVREEIHCAIGNDRMPSREDRGKMPYLEAFMNEVHRKASIVPMTVYHKVMKDCYFGGFFMKKDFIIMPNLYAAHHDQAYWGDPQNFRPERFLDSTGTKVLPKEALMPFSTGKRICLGETLARDTLYLFLTVLLQNFSFELDSSSVDFDINTPTPNFISIPKDFKVIMSTQKVNY